MYPDDMFRKSKKYWVYKQKYPLIQKQVISLKGMQRISCTKSLGRKDYQ